MNPPIDRLPQSAQFSSRFIDQQVLLWWELIVHMLWWFFNMEKMNKVKSICKCFWFFPLFVCLKFMSHSFSEKKWSPICSDDRYRDKPLSVKVCVLNGNFTSILSCPNWLHYWSNCSRNSVGSHLMTLLTCEVSVELVNLWFNWANVKLK